MKLNRKAIMKGRGRIWLLCCCQCLGFVFFLFWQNSFGVCFFLFNSNSLYKCYFKLPSVYFIMSFKKKLFFFNSVIWEFLRTQPWFLRHTHSHMYVFFWVFLFFSARLRNKQEQANSRILCKELHEKCMFISMYVCDYFENLYDFLVRDSLLYKTLTTERCFISTKMTQSCMSGSKSVAELDLGFWVLTSVLSSGH